MTELQNRIMNLDFQELRKEFDRMSLTLAVNVAVVIPTGHPYIVESHISKDFTYHFDTLHDCRVFFIGVRYQFDHGYSSGSE